MILHIIYRAPDSKEKWYLITSLDDFSRFILFSKFVKKETTFKHIKALESVVLKYGIPYSYYVDCHSIFRFVRGRDSYRYRHHKLTDDVTLRIYPLNKNISKIRFWVKNQFVGIRNIKNSDLKGVHF